MKSQLQKEQCKILLACCYLAQYLIPISNLSDLIYNYLCDILIIETQSSKLRNPRELSHFCFHFYLLLRSNRCFHFPFHFSFCCIYILYGIHFVFHFHFPLHCHKRFYFCFHFFFIALRLRYVMPCACRFNLNLFSFIIWHINFRFGFHFDFW